LLNELDSELKHLPNKICLED